MGIPCTNVTHFADTLGSHIACRTTARCLALVSISIAHASRCQSRNRHRDATVRESTGDEPVLTDRKEDD